MYPGNQYYAQHSVDRSQVPPTSTFFQSLSSNYQPMQASNVRQQTTQNQTSSFLPSQILDTSRVHSKQTGSQQLVDGLQNLSSQNFSWLSNGSPSVQQLSQSPYQTARWQQSGIQGNSTRYGAIGSNQSGLVNHPQNATSSVLDYRLNQARQGNRVQSTQLSTVPQASKIFTPSAQQRTTNLSATGNLNAFSNERLLPSSRPSIQRSNSTLNNRLQDPTSLLPNLSNTRLSNLPGNIATPSYNPGSLSSPQSLKLQQQQQQQLQSEKRDKIHIRFGQKSKQLPKPLPRNVASHRASKDSDSESSVKDDDDDSTSSIKTQLENSTHIVIDDDIEIVGTKEAEILPHSRSDCTTYPYVRIEAVDAPPNNANLKFCSKCFCYVCDKLAEQCTKWSATFSPHCNANAKSSCWKARRNMKKSPLMNLLSPEEITKEISQAGELAIVYIIRVREVYIDYRSGISCDFNLVPCECTCHQSKVNKEVCAQCKAVHDTKKKFNYEPVRQVILKIIKEIQKDFHFKPLSALILYEALLSELCSHRPADFNHVTRMPSNPDTRCQCNTPQIMDEYLDWELIKVFTLNEISPSFRDKFIKCVNNSLQPLQLKDIMKRFLQMRHWDDPLLKSALVGQNVGDGLKELPLIIEMRMMKLSKENNYGAALQYLRSVKVTKVPIAKNFTSEGTPIQAAIEKWTLECFAKMGYFQDALIRLSGSLRKLQVNFVLDFFNLLTGKGIPPGTKLVRSFNSVAPSDYTLTGMDKTMLLLIYMMFMEVNSDAQSNFSCYLWLAKWLNEEKIEHKADKALLCIQNSTKLIEWGRKNFGHSSYLQLLQQSQPIPAQTALFVCSSFIMQYFKKQPKNLSRIQEIIDAYKTNDWALFYMFSQSSLLTCGNRQVISWMTDFMKRTGNRLSQFSPESFKILISNYGFTDVCLFMEQWISPSWVNSSIDFIGFFLEMSATFAQRILNEVMSKRPIEDLDWFCTVLFENIVNGKVKLSSTNVMVLNHCAVIGRACSYISLKYLSLYKLFLQRMPFGQTEQKISQVFTFYHDKFKRNELSAKETVELVHCAVETDYPLALSMVFAHYVETHQCPEPTAAAFLIMEEVISILNSSHEYPLKKESLVTSYTRLCAHETLSWLICAKCSANMPVKWIEVWKALDSTGLQTKLYEVVEQTLQLFVTWIKDLSALEENDMKRLHHCLESFFTHVAKTLIEHCKFVADRLQETILKTSNYIVNLQLQHDFRAIIHRIFETFRSSQVSRAEAAPVRNEQVARTVASSEPVPPPEPQRTHSNISIQSISSPPSSKQTVQSPPTSTHTPLKLTISKSRLSTSSSSAGKKTPVSEKSMLSPPIGSPVTSCPQCGDPMTSSVRCSKCYARKTVRCPSCNEMNSAVKGYSCRYCYASLLEVLTSGDQPASHEPAVHEPAVHEPAAPKPEPEKKLKKKLKRKRSEQAFNFEGQQKPADPLPNKPNPVDLVSEKKSKMEEKCPPPPKVLLQKEKEYPTKLLPPPSTKKSPAAVTISLKSSHKKVISKISVNDLTPQPPKPHQRAKEAQRKERPSLLKSTSSIKRTPPVTTTFKTASNLSDSDSDSSSDSPEQIPALILRRKPEEEPIQPTITERKTVPSETNQGPKRSVTSQASSMSKKQRNILQRMKNVGRVKQIPKQPKKLPKNQAPTAEASTPQEWEVQKRRKPGPKSKTSYYSIHPNWSIPRNEQR